MANSGEDLVQATQINSKGLYKKSDIVLICISYSLIYTYFWLELKNIIYNDIDLAYNNIEGDGEQNEGDGEQEDDKKYDAIPYDATNLLGPLVGIAVKTLIQSLLLCLLLFLISSCTSILSLEYNEDIRRITKQSDKKEDIKKLYNFALNDETLVKSPQPSLSLLSIYDLARIKIFPLFFIQNYHFCIGALVVCTLLNYIFVKLILPQISDIYTDKQRMKSQIELIFIINYVVYLGILWYLAYRSLNL